MVKAQTKAAKISLIVIMLISSLLVVGGIAKSYTSSVPVSLTVPTASLEVSGYVAPGALVTIYDGANPMATVTADSSGNFVKLISSIQSGLHSISLSQQDVNGIESSTVNRVVSIPPQQLTQLEFAVPPTIEANTNNLTAGDELRVSGYVYPGANVDLVLDNLIGIYKSKVSDASGFYSFTINTANFYVGNHSLKVRADSPLGYTAYSKNISFIVNVQNNPEKPSEPVSVEKTPIYSGKVGVLTPQINDPPNQASINGDKATIKGTATPNSQIIVTINGVEVGSVFADNKGSWVFNYYPKEAKNIVTVIACVDKKCSDESEPITFYFKVLGSVACRDNIALNKYRFNVAQNEKITLEATFSNERARVIELDWGDGTVEKFSVTADTKEQSYRHAYALVGQYNATITTSYEDEVCVATKFFTAKVETDTSSKMSYLLLIITLIGLLITVFIRVRNKLQLKKTDDSTAN